MTGRDPEEQGHLGGDWLHGQPLQFRAPIGSCDRSFLRQYRSFCWRSVTRRHGRDSRVLRGSLENVTAWLPQLSESHWTQALTHAFMSARLISCGRGYPSSYVRGLTATKSPGNLLASLVATPTPNQGAHMLDLPPPVSQLGSDFFWPREWIISTTLAKLAICASFRGPASPGLVLPPGTTAAAIYHHKQSSTTGIVDGQLCDVPVVRLSITRGLLTHRRYPNAGSESGSSYLDGLKELRSWL